MENYKDLRDDLETVQNQIEKFDNKANILIAIVSIVFAISLNILDIFNQLSLLEMTQRIRIKYIILFILISFYFLTFTLEMIFLILVIYPRKKRNSDENSLTYYLDVSKMTNKQIKTLTTKKNNSKTIIDQLRINSIICTTKHKRLVTAIWLLIPLFLFMFALFFVAII